MNKSVISILCALLLVGLAGCRKPRAQPADTEQARSALRVALDTWQKGERTPKLDQRTILFRDRSQASGQLLRSYQLGEEQVFGYDLRCQVTLELEGPEGKTTRETVVYSIQTAPALIVARVEDD